MTNHVSPNVPAALVYNGEVIAARGENISLTDLWKAAGSPPTKAPSEWVRSADASRFVDFLCESLNMGISHVMKAKQGKGGNTFAHWQIGLAYAKYLSPEFHMWCNSVVRSHMEVRAHGPSLPADVLDLIRRTDGIARMLSHKVTESEKAIDEIRSAIPAIISQSVEAAIASDPRRAVLDYVSVRQLLNEAKAEQHKRNRLNRKIGFELRTRALTGNPPAELRRCPHSGVWLYPRGFTASYMASRGGVLVREHNDAMRGQGVLKLVRKSVAAKAEAGSPAA